MSVKCFLLFCSFSFALQDASAQKDTAFYFFNKDLQVIDSENNATYIGKAFIQEPYWRLTIMNRQTGNIVLKSFYSDSLLTQLESIYELFFDDGQRKTTGFYNAGLEDSLWVTWNEKNMLIDSIVYKNGQLLFRENKIYDSEGILISYQLHDNIARRKIVKNYFSSGQLKDSSGWAGKKGEMKNYYRNGTVSEWAAYDEAGKRVLWEHYKEDGTMISEKEYKKMIDKRIEEFNDNIKANAPEYVGGNGQLGIFLQKNLKLPSGYINIHQNQVIVFSFMLDEKGYAYNAKMIDPHDEELLRAIEEMLRRMPPWNMKGHKSWGPITQRINITH
jgi:antitoxin component YwqK of YwqJK toxin-antitoxin module